MEIATGVDLPKLIDSGPNCGAARQRLDDPSWRDAC